jgi:hypothetical protein
MNGRPLVEFLRPTARAGAPLAWMLLAFGLLRAGPVAAPVGVVLFLAGPIVGARLLHRDDTDILVLILTALARGVLAYVGLSPLPASNCGIVATGVGICGI